VPARLGVWLRSVNAPSVPPPRNRGCCAYRRKARSERPASYTSADMSQRAVDAPLVKRIRVTAGPRVGPHGLALNGPISQPRPADLRGCWHAASSVVVLAAGLPCFMITRFQRSVAGTHHQQRIAVTGAHYLTSRRQRATLNRLVAPDARRVA